VITSFAAGMVGPPFGLKGFVKVKPFEGSGGHLAALKEVVIRREGREGEEKTLKVEEAAVQGGAVLMKFAGIDSPEAARALTGAEVVVDRAHAAPLEKGEFYVEDLKGMEVRGPDGGAIGRITDVIEAGGGDLVEIELPDGKKRLVPFRKEFFGEIGVEEGFIVLRETWVLE